MATGIPPALRSADIARYAQRAGQVEKAKPSIAYWCNYWIVNQLISRGLHNVDEECTRYTTDLMDKLEKVKTERGEDDTIMDDVAAQVYVEQFALETFQRAENAMRASKASRQTADTLLAAAAFLELRQIWEPLDADTSSKVKYAKYHALRIAKAIKAGEDPNLTNPDREPAPSQGPPISSIDPDSHMLDGRSVPSAAFQPSVEEVSDEQDGSEAYRAQEALVNQPQQPYRAPMLSPRPGEAVATPPEVAPTTSEAENYYQQPSVPDVSPLQSPDRGRNGSIGGGYFPNAPDTDHNHGQNPVANGREDVLHNVPPSNLPDVASLPPLDPFSSAAPPNPSANSFGPFPPRGPGQDTAPPPSAPVGGSPYQQIGAAPAQSPRYPQPTAPSGMPQPYPAHAHQVAPASFQPSTQQRNTSQTVIDEEALAKAQKHARWAISALNFEDVNTAIKELRGALESLGAK